MGLSQNRLNQMILVNHHSPYFKMPLDCVATVLMTPMSILHWLNHNSYWLSHHVSHSLLAKPWMFTVVCSPFSRKKNTTHGKIMPNRNSWWLKPLTSPYFSQLFVASATLFAQSPRTSAPWRSCFNRLGIQWRQTRKATRRCTRRQSVAISRPCSCCWKRGQRWMAQAVAYLACGLEPWNFMTFHQHPPSIT